MVTDDTARNDYVQMHAGVLLCAPPMKDKVDATIAHGSVVWMSLRDARPPTCWTGTAYTQTHMEGGGGRWGG